jgi:hypothetical protein
MNEGQTVFAQLMGERPQHEFDKCLRRYLGDHRVRSLFPYEHFLVMVFAQLTTDLEPSAFRENTHFAGSFSRTFTNYDPDTHDQPCLPGFQTGQS